MNIKRSTAGEPLPRAVTSGARNRPDSKVTSRSLGAEARIDAIEGFIELGSYIALMLGSPGGCIGVLDGAVHEASFGFARLPMSSNVRAKSSRGDPMMTDHRFPLNSFTKLLTAYLFMKLAGDSDLLTQPIHPMLMERIEKDRSEKVSGVTDALVEQMRDASHLEGLTILNLLTMTAAGLARDCEATEVWDGMRRVGGGRASLWRTVVDRENFFALDSFEESRRQHPDLHGVSESMFKYSNVSYAVAGLVLEYLAEREGKTVDQLRDPLLPESVTFEGPTFRQAHGYALVHEIEPLDLQPLTVANPPDSIPTSIIAGRRVLVESPSWVRTVVQTFTGLYGDITGVLRIVETMLQDKEIVHEMVTGGTKKYGIGVERPPEGSANETNADKWMFVHSGGQGPYFSSAAGADLEEERPLVCAVMLNTASPYAHNFVVAGLELFRLAKDIANDAASQPDRHGPRQADVPDIRGPWRSSHRVMAVVNVLGEHVLAVADPKTAAITLARLIPYAPFETTLRDGTTWKSPRWKIDPTVKNLHVRGEFVRWASPDEQMGEDRHLFVGGDPVFNPYSPRWTQNRGRSSRNDAGVDRVTIEVRRVDAPDGGLSSIR